MARAQLRRQQIDDTTEALLRATRALVAEGGWPAAQISAIAARAGVATGSVYRYFDSKAALCVQVLARVSEREADVVAAIIDGGGDPAGRLRDAVAGFVRRAAGEPRLAYALIAEPCDPAIDAARLRYRDALAAQFARLIDEGRRSGAFADLPADLVSTCLVGAMMEPLILPLAREAPPRGAELERLAAQVARACLNMVRNAEAGTDTGEDGGDEG
ncbi:TetR/AcrR family transcriptional regulator [Marinibaculum pumilum]|uniref:TetR/AcrR family transcriptional regulator n=1 Tax=Marinibaculum pumilum TaxID=1766165 RepID=A0ABV7KV11_9PROT